jgi:Flp pilus assembly pilin Flp
MTEYILIVALIAVFVIGAIKLFGRTTKKGFSDAANTVGSNVQDAVNQSSKP